MWLPYRTNNVDSIYLILTLMIMICVFITGFGAGSAYRRRIKTVRKLLINDWASLATGKSGWIEIEKEFLRAQQTQYKIFCDRQKKYGPYNIGVGGLAGVGVRIGDKVSRIWEMLGLSYHDGLVNTGRDVNFADDSKEDAFIDVANYGTIGLLVLRGKWPMLNQSDAWGPGAIEKLYLELGDKDGG
jgi:hypothetical protein